MKQIANAQLSEYSGFGCGGTASVLIEAENREELKNTVDLLEKQKKTWYLLGKGYNTLVSDNGVKGVVIRLTGDFCNANVKDNYLIAGGGASLPEILKIAAEYNLGGLEFLAGIPGTVGGAIFNNSGTSERSIAGNIEEVEIYSVSANSYGRLKNKEIGFGYRRCGLLVKDIITEAVFNLKTENKTDIIKIIKCNIELKNKKQPVSDKSCGCIFKNPDNGQTSVSRLIEMAGLKGFKIGGAQISNVHANFIVNTGNATSSNIWELIKKVRGVVKQKFDKEIELEISLLGEGFEY